ncbi:hypothetical protein AB0D45_33730 [Streptomyces sp. NPDC048352]
MSDHEPAGARRELHGRRVASRATAKVDFRPFPATGASRTAGSC